MNYPDWNETKESMWAAERNFPMIDEETPTFMAQPHAKTKEDLHTFDYHKIDYPR